MSVSINTNDGSQYQKPTVAATAGAVVAGSTLQGAIVSANDLFSSPLINKMRDLNKGTDKVEISNALKNAIEKGGIKDKVELINLTAEKNFKSIGEFYKDFFKRIKSGKVTMFDFIDLQSDMIKEGFNAGFSPINNKILVNTEKMGLAGFHEIGHAINFNNSKFWKAMQKYRLAALPLTGLLTLTALLKRKKVEGEEPKGFFDKATTFIKENVGKLTFLTLVPMVAEELKATARGNKLAKELLNPDLYKKVVKSNRFGAASYIGIALLMPLSAYLANKLKDHLAKPKPIEKES